MEQYLFQGSVVISQVIRRLGSVQMLKYLWPQESVYLQSRKLHEWMNGYFIVTKAFGVITFRSYIIW